MGYNSALPILLVPLMMLISQRSLRYQCHYNNDTDDLVSLVESIVLGVYSAESNSDDEPEYTCRCGEDLHHPVEPDFIEPA